MNPFRLVTVFTFILICVAILTSVNSGLTFAAEEAQSVGTSSEGSEPYNQLVTLQGGLFHPASVNISNGSYAFQYAGNSLNSYLIEAGWSANLFHFLGEFSFEENFGYTNFSGVVQTPAASMGQKEKLTVNVFGIDTRIMHSWDWFPIHAIIPFWDAGAQYTLYYQSGASDLDSVQGGVWNPVAGFGLRFWLNRSSSLSHDYVNRLSSLPIFLTLKVNDIFPSPGGINLAGISYLGGINVGL
jgi:hypothetical protein